jgi:signal peptidase I
LEKATMKKHKKQKELNIPPSSDLENLLAAEKYRLRFRRMLMNTIFTMIIVASISVLIAVYVIPVIRIYGESMSPTIINGDVVVTLANPSLKRGDIIAFYHNNKVLAKRVIAFSGEWVDIDEDGIVYIDSEPLDEPYIDETALGDCTIDLPYQVPEGSLFVMGDNRSISLDSRDSAIGSISEEEIVGKLILRIWPFTRIGKI